MNGAQARGAFLPVLRDLERRLALPLPDRIRILRELEQDLEALTERFVAEGDARAEASRRAKEALIPDKGTLEELDRLHRPFYSRLTGGIPPGRVRLLERGALVAATAIVLAGQAATLLQANLLSDPSPFLVPTSALGGVLLAMVLAKGFQLWVKGDHADPGRGLAWILGTSGMVLTLGMSGAILDSYRLAATLERVPALAEAMVLDWLVQDAALLSVAIIIALSGGLAWFAFSHWITLLSGARQDLLGPDTRYHSPKE